MARVIELIKAVILAFVSFLTSPFLTVFLPTSCPFVSKNIIYFTMTLFFQHTLCVWCLYFQESHMLKTISDTKYARLAALSDMNVFKHQILNPMLIERVSDTDGKMRVQRVM